MEAKKLENRICKYTKKSIKIQDGNHRGRVLMFVFGTNICDDSRSNTRSIAWQPY